VAGIVARATVLAAIAVVVRLFGVLVVALEGRWASLSLTEFLAPALFFFLPIAEAACLFQLFAAQLIEMLAVDLVVGVGAVLNR
jgi:hypothetical protein